MPEFSPIEVNVATVLGELGGICDLGFALAIHVRFTRPTLLYQTYAIDWVDLYSEKGYMLSDPTVHWGLSNTGSIEWTQLQDRDPEGVISAAQDYGIQNGWTYATGPATSRSFGSMASSTPLSAAIRARCCAIIDDIHRLTDGFEGLPKPVQDRLRTLL